MIGLVPWDPFEDDLCSEGLLFPFSEEFGGVDLRPGVLLPDFFSSELSELALEEGLSSGFFDTTLVSYGLKARCLLSGEERGLSFITVLFGDVRLTTSLLTLFTDFFFSSGGRSGLAGEVSAPIWLQVCAKSASGLFLESICNKEK